MVRNIYLNNKYVGNNIENKWEPSMFYFKLPYTGKLLIALKSKIKWICTRYNINKLKNMLGAKDSLLLKSFVVYNFICAGYVGLTACHLMPRIKEHFKDKQSQP